MVTTDQKKTVWITGASSGIGYDLALTYAKNGHRVIASARGVAKLESLRQEAMSLEGEVISLPLNVTDKAAVEAATQRVQDDYCLPDIVVLNAGYYEPLELAELTLEHFEKTYSVNVSGVVNGMMAVLHRFRERGRGHIVIVSSVAGYSGLPRAAAYGSSKAALTHLAESLRHECAAAGITISVVNPGFVKTPLTDLNSFSMPFMIDSNEAAQRMYSGIAAEKFEITFPRTLYLATEIYAPIALPYLLPPDSRPFVN